MQNIEEINREIQRFMNLTPEPTPPLNKLFSSPSFSSSLSNNRPISPLNNSNSAELIKFLEKTLARNKTIEEELRLIKIQNFNLNEFQIKSTKQETQIKDLYVIIRNNESKIKTIEARNDELTKQNTQITQKEKTMKDEINFFSNQINKAEIETKNLENSLLEQKKSKGLIKEQFLELEKITKLLQRKLNDKQNTLNFLNSELNKFINTEKKMSLKVEGLSEKAGYFEQLYISMEKQNDNLIQKLKQIKGGDFKLLLKENNIFREKLKAGGPTITFSETETNSSVTLNNNKTLSNCKIEKETKNRTQIKNLKKQIESSNNKISLLNKELEQRKEFSNKQSKENNLIIDNLMKKMENLLEENLRYQTLIYKQPTIATNTDNINNNSTNNNTQQLHDSFFTSPSFDATKEAIKIQNIFPSVAQKDQGVYTNHNDENNDEAFFKREPTFTDNIFNFLKKATSQANSTNDKYPNINAHNTTNKNIISNNNENKNIKKVDVIKNMINNDIIIDIDNNNEDIELEESDLVSEKIKRAVGVRRGSNTNNIDNTKNKLNKEKEELSNSKILSAREQNELKEVIERIQTPKPNNIAGNINTDNKRNVNKVHINKKKTNINKKKINKIVPPSYDLKELSLEDFDIPTTESMKEIRSKTKQLDKKFQDLNTKLNKIRGSDTVSSKEKQPGGNILYSSVELQDEDFL
ncbi:hypothetical protein CDIK_1324 [Cucumispora dikerogammari]|nr:hypothetical protein CDIK_1324 [Cucumispora dikerogammari]